MPVSLAGAMLACLGAFSASAIEFEYDGEFFFCTSTCDSFASLGGSTGGSQNATNSIITGSISIVPAADGSFAFDRGDNVPFAFEIFNAAVPMVDTLIEPSPDCPFFTGEVGQICNLTQANPLPIDSATAEISGSGIVENGVIVSGVLDIVFTVSPLSNNQVVITFDLSDGSVEGTLFGGVITFLRASGSFSGPPDTDDDGVADAVDNCIDTSNADQRDTNLDGFGNACDADLNNDCDVNAVDLGVFRTQFFFADGGDADFNGDGTVSILDLGVLRSLFFAPPGPSGTTSECSVPLG
ncbi:MAG: hypothetical protein AB8G17_09110 [Gammaproteobacteria bacterium]